MDRQAVRVAFDPDWVLRNSLRDPCNGRQQAKLSRTQVGLSPRKQHFIGHHGHDNAALVAGNLHHAFQMVLLDVGFNGLVYFIEAVCVLLRLGVFDETFAGHLARLAGVHNGRR